MRTNGPEKPPPRHGDVVLRAAMVAMVVGVVGVVVLVAMSPRPPRETVAERATGPASPLEQAGPQTHGEVGTAERVDDQRAAVAPLRQPEGFRAAPGAGPEPHTGTGWAEEIIHEASGIAMVYVPAGSFTMGSPADEAGRDSDETQYRVTLTEGFYLGKAEVTQEQWQEAMGNNPSFDSGAGADAPVERVSWDDCQQFCAKLGNGLRLPTEAEWEYACRAGTTGPYAGDLDGMAWHGLNSGNATHAVAQKQPNAWGLYDMNGNVWEWCQDWYGDYPADSATDPAGPAQGSYRVGRGRGWNHIGAAGFRAANRDYCRHGTRDANLGFRLARTAGFL